MNISQTFAIWIVPFHRSHVNLTTQLQLTHPPNSKKYYISSQNDLYQTDQAIQFLLPWGVGTALVWMWHLWATFFCVLGAILLAPVTWLEQTWADREQTIVEKTTEDEMQKLVDLATQATSSGGGQQQRQKSDEQQFGNMHVIRPN